MSKESHELEDLEPLEGGLDDDLAPLEELGEELGEAVAEVAQPRASAGPRELERAPLVLRKAALILTVSALLPWLVPGGWDPMRVAAKALVLLAGWLLYLGVLHSHGEKQKVPGFFQKIGDAHPLALDILALVIALVGIAPLIDGGSGDNTFGTIVEKAALAIGIGAWCQVLAYEKGGKFNPVMGLIIPLLGIASVGRVVTVFTDQESFDLFALLGSAGVTLAAVIAGYTMVLAMKEAKAHGEAKKRAALEHRKAARKAKRDQGG